MTKLERSKLIEKISEDLLDILRQEGALAGNDLMTRYLEDHTVDRASAELALSLLFDKEVVGTDSQMRLEAAA